MAGRRAHRAPRLSIRNLCRKTSIWGRRFSCMCSAVRRADSAAGSGMASKCDWVADWQFEGKSNYLHAEELQRPALLLLCRRCFRVLARLAALISRSGREKATRRRSISNRRGLLQHVVPRFLKHIISLGDEQRVSSKHANIRVGFERPKVLWNACTRSGIKTDERRFLTLMKPIVTQFIWIIHTIIYHADLREAQASLNHGLP